MTTIKYHAEYTGEGIEYAWGVMKSAYQKIKLEDKKGKEIFINNVKVALSRDNALTVHSIWQFGKRT